MVVADTGGLANEAVTQWQEPHSDPAYFWRQTERAGGREEKTWEEQVSENIWKKKKAIGSENQEKWSGCPFKAGGGKILPVVRGGNPEPVVFHPPSQGAWEAISKGIVKSGWVERTACECQSRIKEKPKR